LFCFSLPVAAPHFWGDPDDSQTPLFRIAHTPFNRMTRSKIFVNGRLAVVGILAWFLLAAPCCRFVNQNRMRRRHPCLFVNHFQALTTVTPFFYSPICQLLPIPPFPSVDAGTPARLILPNDSKFSIKHNKTPINHVTIP
jgi:hypothetical protein